MMANNRKDQPERLQWGTYLLAHNGMLTHYFPFIVGEAAGLEQNGIWYRYFAHVVDDAGGRD